MRLDFDILPSSSAKVPVMDLTNLEAEVTGRTCTTCQVIIINTFLVLTHDSSHDPLLTIKVNGSFRVQNVFHHGFFCLLSLFLLFLFFLLTLPSFLFFFCLPFFL